MQQELVKQWTQQLLSMNPLGAGSGAGGEASRNLQKRWIELGIELLNKHRQSLDSTYSAGIQIIEQTFRATDARSPDDYRHLMEELWRKLFDTYKSQTEAQFNAFQHWSSKSAEVVHDAQA